jgi:hypothetical protein
LALAHIANSGIFLVQSLKQGTKCRISTTRVKTGQYPTENEARETFQLTVNRWLEIIADKKEATN